MEGSKPAPMKAGEAISGLCFSCENRNPLN